MAGIDAVFFPSLFSGDGPARFYAANGWGTTASTGALSGSRLLAPGISLRRSATRRPAAGVVARVTARR
ncbi:MULTISPECIES: hypothetical protein [Streptomyces]|uniref:hypothetical protein n=1 Tax=Streptomyces TaxID=1883 RepID=UPI000A3D0008|nr:hypothetical protein [Streptomyces viridochromogenes]